MNQSVLLKQLAVNALFWVGIVAIVLSLLSGSLYFLIFFVGLVVFNYVIVNLIAKAQPQALTEITSLASAAAPSASMKSGDSGVLGFRLTPVEYPKVMDSELRDFAPEFINVDIEQNGSVIFSGNFARGALKQFRDGITQVLTVKEVPKNKEEKKEATQPKNTTVPLGSIQINASQATTAGTKKKKKK